MGLTRYVLKRPVTTILALLCILVFGISSVFSATLEQMPDTDQPMLIIRASYQGVTLEDMDELVTKPIEDQVSRLEGVKSMSSTSNEGNAMIRHLNRDEKVAVLMVSHDIGNIVTQANKILQLKQTVQFYGTVEEYKKSEFGREFLGGES